MTDLGKRTRDWLVCLMRYVVGLLMFALVEIANEIMAIFGWVAGIPSIVIPGLDFEAPQIPVEVLGWINWLFPLQLLAPAFVSGITAYSVLRVMRFWSARTRGFIRPRD